MLYLCYICNILKNDTRSRKRKYPKRTNQKANNTSLSSSSSPSSSLLSSPTTSFNQTPTISHSKTSHKKKSLDSEDSLISNKTKNYREENKKPNKLKLNNNGSANRESTAVGRSNLSYLDLEVEKSVLNARDILQTIEIKDKNKNYSQKSNEALALDGKFFQIFKL